ncbi:Rha family transcriptional regulator [Psychrobacter sp. I-STPA6b]|uniref:Rha family transcriptional regulator n=1 Tax=Psychrobacter sp. I-STPA6b TaxID=2585718 RepID=UPI001D0CC5FE|nr:Rha family transcriptional regulator [Psychrobacter sp. I-STPA6b]
MLPLELVSIEDEIPMTNSLKVAKFFGKRHSDVLSKINSIDCSEEFSKRNFTLANYHDEQGKPRCMFQMTKDGFMFLVMGFTGKKAARLKEAYINEFNRMSNILNQRQNSLMYQYNKIIIAYDNASLNASNAGRALAVLGKRVKPELQERLEKLEAQMQLVLNFDNEKADHTDQSEMSALLKP